MKNNTFIIIFIFIIFSQNSNAQCDSIFNYLINDTNLLTNDFFSGEKSLQKYLTYKLNLLIYGKVVVSKKKSAIKNKNVVSFYKFNSDTSLIFFEHAVHNRHYHGLIFIESSETLIDIVTLKKITSWKSLISLMNSDEFVCDSNDNPYTLKVSCVVQ